MITVWYRTIVVAVVAFTAGTSRSLAQTGVAADSSVGTVSLSTFQGLSASHVCGQIDGMAFWAVPLDPPTGYYQAADTSSAAALRRTLHEIIDDHRVFPYTNRSKPGDNNHVVDTWDVIALADAHPNDPGRVLDIYLNGTFDRQLTQVEHF